MTTTENDRKWFRYGVKYKVLNDIGIRFPCSKRSHFIPGEWVTLESISHSAADSTTRYSFVVVSHGPSSGNFRSFVIHDAEAAPSWLDFFEIQKSS